MGENTRHRMKANMRVMIVPEPQGRASVGITMDLYSHVTLDMQEMAGAAMSALIEMATGTA